MSEYGGGGMREQGRAITGGLDCTSFRDFVQRKNCVLSRIRGCYRKAPSYVNRAVLGDVESGKTNLGEPNIAACSFTSAARLLHSSP